MSQGPRLPTLATGKTKILVTLGDSVLGPRLVRTQDLHCLVFNVVFKVHPDTGRIVDNAITSTFQFKDGEILHHNDDCDPVAWADMAMTGPKAWLAGHSRPVRALAANKKLQEFLRTELERSNSAKCG